MKSNKALFAGIKAGSLRAGRLGGYREAYFPRSLAEGMQSIQWKEEIRA